MSIAERRAEEKTERRNAITDAAVAQFAKKGIDGTTYGDIAKQARLSRSLLYTYFDDTNALLLAVAERAEQALADAFEAAVADEDRGLDQLLAIFHAYFAFLQDNPVYAEALARAKQLTATDAAQKADANLRCSNTGSATQITGEVLATGIRDGSIRKDIPDPRELGLALRGATLGFAILTEQMAVRLKEWGISPNQIAEIGQWLIREALEPKARSDRP